MHRLYALMLLTLLLLPLYVPLAFAQGGVVPEPNVVEDQGSTTPDDGGFDWGWLGLIGLAGLAGLTGRRR